MSCIQCKSSAIHLSCGRCQLIERKCWGPGRNMRCSRPGTARAARALPRTPGQATRTGGHDQPRGLMETLPGCGQQGARLMLDGCCHSTLAADLARGDRPRGSAPAAGERAALDIVAPGLPWSGDQAQQRHEHTEVRRRGVADSEGRVRQRLAWPDAGSCSPDSGPGRVSQPFSTSAAAG